MFYGCLEKFALRAASSVLFFVGPCHWIDSPLVRHPISPTVHGAEQLAAGVWCAATGLRRSRLTAYVFVTFFFILTHTMIFS